MRLSVTETCLFPSIRSPEPPIDQSPHVFLSPYSYGIIQAFRLGKYPSNAQVDESLTYAINNSPIDDSKLSSDGKQLVQDFRDIIETFRVIVKKKNADELMQNFLVRPINQLRKLPRRV
jgi:hypothetical protein